MPLYGPSGDVVFHQFRPDEPRVKDCKPVKYETPGGSRMVMDVHPARALGRPVPSIAEYEGRKDLNETGTCCHTRVAAVTTRKGVRMDFASRKAYPDNDEYTLAIFDLRYPGVSERLHSERAAWGDHGDLEAVDEDHFVLIMRPGGSRVAAA